MNNLALQDFSDYFQAVHGYPPYPWQVRLTETVIKTGKWPTVIDLPTGSGKTAVLDTAIFALALQPEVFPRRVVFVIDRRIIVDQVHARAAAIGTKIAEGSHPVLTAMRESLALHCGDTEDALGVVALRGGGTISREWAERPDQPWVMVSTVDQFGSRLLFRGYGVTPGMRPIHAGLTGNDCLVILDEVHLSRPFRDTLQAVSELGRGSLPQRFQVVQMSATPDDMSGSFRLLDEDLETSSTLRTRLRASKTGRLVELASGTPEVAIPKGVARLINKELPSAVKTVGVVVNRVLTARKTYEALQEKGVNAHLLTGRMRPLDRTDLLEKVIGSVSADRTEQAEELTVLVATQAIEVGADFSFDALITECAPIDSLKQRFGRLDRRGRYGTNQDEPAQAWILGVKAELKKKQPDPIYGESLCETWNELNRRFGSESFDVGTMSSDLEDFPDNTRVQPDQAPLLLPTHIEAWCQTRPAPLVEPSVEPFLHGIGRRANTDVNLVWRHDRTAEVLRLVPPRPAEYLPVPIGAAKAWLSRHEGDQIEEPVADVDYPETGPEETNKRTTIKALKWQGLGEDPQPITKVSSLRPGDILLIDPDVGGISSGNWDPLASEPVSDLGDRAQHEYGKRHTLRLDTRVYHPGNHPGIGTLVAGEDADDTTRDRVREWLKTTAADIPGNWLSEACASLLMEGWELNPSTESDYPIVIQKTIDMSTIDGSDIANSFTGSGVTLRSHLDGVGEKAKAFARRLGLGVNLQEDLELAGRLHDLGKVDLRFQSRLVGNDPVRLERHRDEPLAKSLPGTRRVFRPYPKGMRHEVASLALVQSNPDVLAPAHDRDLVQHLISTHHGWGRSLLPVLKDQAAEKLEYVFDGKRMSTSSDLADSDLALEAADRFWRLTRRYGPYGLAWLEAILRTADHYQSAEESQ